MIHRRCRKPDPFPIPIFVENWERLVDWMIGFWTDPHLVDKMLSCFTVIQYSKFPFFHYSGSVVLSDFLIFRHYQFPDASTITSLPFFYSPITRFLVSLVITSLPFLISLLPASGSTSFTTSVFYLYPLFHFSIIPLFHGLGSHLLLSCHKLPDSQLPVIRNNLNFRRIKSLF
jgi:hypothetical protein